MILSFSLKNLHRVLKDADDFSESLSSLGHSGWLAKGLCKFIAVVDVVVKFKLERVLGLLDQEETNKFWNLVLDASYNDVKVLINSPSHLINELVISSFLLDGLSSHHVLSAAWVLLLCFSHVSLRLTTTTWLDNTLSCVLIISVISEQIVLFTIDNAFKENSRLLFVLSKNSCYEFHHVGDHGWESLEDLVDQLTANHLALSVDIVKKLKCWLLEFVKLRSDEEDEDID